MTVQVPKVIPNDWTRLRIIVDKLKHLRLGLSSHPTFAGLTLTDLTASSLLQTDAEKKLESIALPLIVAKGGTGAITLTDHGILLGSGTGAVTPLGVAGDGYIPIGYAGEDPVLATITGTANQVTVSNAAGSITLSTPQDIDQGATPTFAGLISTGVVRATDFAKTGWPVTSGVTLSFDNATKVFKVTDGGSAYYYIDGVKYTLGGDKTVDLDDIGIAEGLWYIYFVGATLTASQTVWSFRDEDKALVAYLHWDATNNKATFLGYELHSFHMDGVTHARLHYAGGARWEIGLLVSDNLDDTVDVSNGDIWDEDLNIPIINGEGDALFEQILSPARLPIYYRDGASAWRIYEIGDKAAVTDVGYVDGSNDLKYNKLNGTWANATVGGNNYVAYYVVATNEQTEPVALIMGQRVDNKLSDAKVNNVFAGLSLAGLPFEEMVVLARLILKDDAAYTLEEVLDLRAYNIKGNITSPLITQHGGLGGLGNDDHAQYALLAGRSGGQTLSGSPNTGEDLTLKDNTTDNNTITITQAIAAYTHSQIAGGNSVHVSTTENTNWDAAYTHSGLTSGNPHSVTPAELSLVIGTNVQAFGAVLDDLNTLGAPASDGQFIVATGTGTFAYEATTTARTSLGLGIGDSPQFTGIELGHASDTTLTRASAGDVNIESNIIYRAGGTDVPITDGGTGQSTAQAAINALSAVSGATNEHVLTKDTATSNAVWKAAAGGGTGSCVRVHRNSANQTTGAAGADNTIQFTTEDTDLNNEFDNSVNYRFTPTTAGYYLVYLTVTITNQGNIKWIGADVFFNGARTYTNSFVATGLAGGSYISCSVTTIIYCNGSTDYIEGHCRCEEANRTISGDPTLTWMHIVKLSI